MRLVKSLQRLWRSSFSGTPRLTAWNGAGQGRRLSRWQPEQGSINTLLLGHMDTLRARSREIARNNPYAANAIDALVANCIGTGIKPQSKALQPAFRKAVHDLWLAWTDEADMQGNQDFYGLQATVCRAMIEGGECLVRLRVNLSTVHNHVPLQLQVMEAEHLEAHNDRLLENGHIIRGGIELNQKGHRVAYHLKREHPGEQSLLRDASSLRIPAQDILHIYRPLRPGQLRGEPWLSRVLLKLYELDQYDDAELVRKKTSAMYTGFVTRLDPEANIMGESEGHENGIAIAHLEPGTLQILDPGEDVRFSEPADVGGSYEAFMRQQLRSVAVGMGITYEQLTGDLTGVNYSSIRAGLIEFRRRCEMLQHHIIVHQLCRPVWQRWLQLALLSEALKAPDKGTSWQAVKWIPQGWEWVDPLKDQQAQQMAVRNGFKSRSQVVSELGYNVEDIDEEIAGDHLRAEALNLDYDSHSRKTQ